MIFCFVLMFVTVTILLFVKTNQKEKKNRKLFLQLMCLVQRAAFENVFHSLLNKNLKTHWIIKIISH